jgi:hypothetical protein
VTRLGEMTVRYLGLGGHLVLAERNDDLEVVPVVQLDVPATRLHQHLLHLANDQFSSVLRVQNVYRGSRIRAFPITDPGSASKNLSTIFKYLNPKWFLSSRKYDPGCSSWIRILIFYPSRTPDPGVKKVPDPGSGTLVISTDPATDPSIIKQK